MAEYCRQCAKAVDLMMDMTPPAKKGTVSAVICEGCGPCVVDSRSRCVEHLGKDRHWYKHAKDFDWHTGNKKKDRIND